MYVVAARFEDASTALRALARVAHRIGARPPAAAIRRLAFESAGHRWIAPVAAARVRDADVRAARDELREAGGVLLPRADAEAVELPRGPH